MRGHSTRLLAVDPLVDSRSAKTPQFANLNTRDLPPKHHPLQGAGMNVKHRRGLVAVE
jgi:hypothetical protein